MPRWFRNNSEKNASFDELSSAFDRFEFWSADRDGSESAKTDITAGTEVDQPWALGARAAEQGLEPLTDTLVMEGVEVGFAGRGNFDGDLWGRGLDFTPTDSSESCI